MTQDFKSISKNKIIPVVLVIILAIGLFIYFAVESGNKPVKKKITINTFKTSKTFVSLGNYYNEISCPTATVCFATGSSALDQTPVVAKSTDSGDIWTNLNLPKEVTAVDAITCPTLNDCMVAVSTFFDLGGTIITTDDGGLTWTVDSTQSQGQVLSSVNCISVKFCISSVSVVDRGNILIYSTDFGSTWNSLNVKGSDLSLSLDPITYCYSSNFCLISGTDSVKNTTVHSSSSVNDLESYIGYINSKSYNVSYYQLPSYISYISSISCVNANKCYALGMADSVNPVMISTDSYFKSVKLLGFPKNVGSLVDLSCNSSYKCILLGSSKSNNGLIFYYSIKSNSLYSIKSNIVDVPELDLSSCNFKLSFCIVGGSNQHLTYTAFNNLTLKQVTIYSSTSSSSHLPISSITLATYRLKKYNHYNSYKNILIVGDSTATILAVGLQMDQLEFGDIVFDGSIVGCGLVPNSPGRYTGKKYNSIPACFNWENEYQSAVNTSKPQISVLLIGPWDVISRSINGTYLHIGDLQYDQIFEANLKDAIKILTSNGSKLVILNSPYFFHGFQPNFSLWPQDDPVRVNTLNSIENNIAKEFPNTVRVIPFGQHISPGNEYQRVVNGIEVRTPDGIHFTVIGSIYESYWILNQINNLSWQTTKTNKINLKNKGSKSKLRH
jgi:hypothetical protein